MPEPEVTAREREIVRQRLADAIRPFAYLSTSEFDALVGILVNSVRDIPAAARAEERERCASIADAIASSEREKGSRYTSHHTHEVAEEIAAEIRAGG